MDNSNQSESVPLVYFDLSQETLTSSVVSFSNNRQSFTLVGGENSSARFSNFSQNDAKQTKSVDREGKTKKLKKSLLMMVPSILDWFLEDPEESVGQCTKIKCSSADMYAATRCYRRKVKKPMGFTEAVLNKYSLDDFRVHFRMSRGTFEKLLKVLAKRGENLFFRTHGGGRPPVPMETSVMLALWYMVTTESLSKIGNRFGVTGSTTFRCVRILIQALTGDLYNELICWPDSDEQLQMQDGFRHLQGLPNVVGVINSLHLPVRTPSDAPENYRNKSGRTSIILQAVCNNKLKIIDCFSQCPGQMDNYDVLQVSDLYQKMQDSSKSVIPEGSYLLADETYPLLPWILTPYSEYGNITSSHKLFNNIHKDTKGVIDTMFRVLLTRFHRLRYLDMDLDFAYKFVSGACVVYNHCVVSGEPCIVDNIPMKTDVNGRSVLIRDDMSASVSRVQIMQRLSMQRGTH